MNSLKVSIIVPFYNRLDLLDKTIESVFNQSSANWELILVDDGTDEDKRELYEKYKLENVYFINKTTSNKGANYCRNLGAKAANYQHLIFLDSDDLLTPWCVETRIKEVLKEKEADLWLFNGVEFDSLLNEFTRLRTIYKCDDPLREFLNFQSVCQTSCAVWKKEVFEEIGGWDETVDSWQDGEIFVRYLAHKNNYVWSSSELPDVLIRKHNSENRISNTKGVNTDKLNNLFQTYQSVLNYLEEPYLTQFKENIILSLYDQSESVSKNTFSTYSNWINSLNITDSDKRGIKKYAYLYSTYNKSQFMNRLLYQIRKTSLFFKKRKGFWSVRPEVSIELKNKLNYLISNQNE